MHTNDELDHILHTFTTSCCTLYFHGCSFPAPSQTHTNKNSMDPVQSVLSRQGVIADAALVCPPPPQPCCRPHPKNKKSHGPHPATYSHRPTEPNLPPCKQERESAPSAGIRNSWPSGGICWFRGSAVCPTATMKLIWWPPRGPEDARWQVEVAQQSRHDPRLPGGLAGSHYARPQRAPGGRKAGLDSTPTSGLTGSLHTPTSSPGWEGLLCALTFGTC